MHNHSIARLQAGHYFAETIVESANLHRPSRNFVSLGQHVNDLLALIAIDGSIMDQQGVVSFADRQANSPEEAR